MITTMAIRRPKQADRQAGLTIVPRNREAYDWVSFGLLGRDTVGRATQ
ncbi:hypothetical protein ALC60_00574 [Trachymyrmex zeteki]|uniref:Uncharacterized protein n=1 Tax=Mycetomoellerius zeteki TaxID=64791 RepID=A0A151XIQ6_9HYME|nr:hypothetical protein ALC60_00574 [Trachymyrmex zeteki]